ncbi:hypothetical protein CULT_880019 [[Clostridium] ultunense Esp]|nr:hypothetical protein CULT_880019 [[Clostridium] ultunense Esp]
MNGGSDRYHLRERRSGKDHLFCQYWNGPSMLGKKVCMIDTDIGLRNLDVLMGLENRIIFDLVDVVEGRCRLEQAIVRDKHFEDRLVMLPAAQTKDKSAVTPDQMKKLVDKLKPSYDYILLDSPAGIEQGFNNAVAGAIRPSSLPPRRFPPFEMPTG